MGLLESGHSCQPQTGELAVVDALHHGFPEIFLEGAKFHPPKYSIHYSLRLLSKIGKLHIENQTKFLT